MKSVYLRLAAALAVSSVASLSMVSVARAANDPALQAQYEKQRAACIAGKSTEDRATCLKEAGAALEDARRGRLSDGDANYRKNEMDRCKALSGADQRDCLARMKGSGTVSGSVAGGGILREKTTKEIVRPAEVIPATPAASAGG